MDVCGPGTNITEPFPNGASQGEWQCTELVARYLYIVYGAPSIVANGDQVVANYANTYPNLFTSVDNTNGNPNHVWPKVGDVISYSDVHTAIITTVTITDATNGNATLGLIEQNTSSTNGTTTQKFVSWKIKGDIDDPNDTGSDTVTAWLTPKESWNNYGPGGTTQDDIYSMAASSPTSVWAAGYEQLSGQLKQPVTYYHDSVQWHKYMPPSLGTSYNHWLYGIASSSSGDTWAVGEVDYGYSKTLAYHWNSSTQTWSLVTSDNVSTYATILNSVAIDGSGNVWAVGQYWTSGGLMPVLEKWNGTKFALQTISLPSGETSGILSSIAFSSSTNGWAVGYVTGSVTNAYVIYHYDGTSWTPSLGPSNTDLISVAVVADSEAWAIGAQGTTGTPLILHYTSANAWQEDTSFNGYYPTSTTLKSVGTDGASDVWIVGKAGSAFFTMHYNGYYWDQFITPSPTGTSGGLQGVAVNSGYAWAGGYRYQSAYYPVVLQYA